MTSENNKKGINTWYVVLVVLILVSIGVNVYLFSEHAKEDDAVEVMVDLLQSQPWEAIGAHLEVELSSLTSMLEQMADRQTAQETATKEIRELLENEPWSADSLQIQGGLDSIAATLDKLEERQLTQERAINDIIGVLKDESWSMNNEHIKEGFSGVSQVLVRLEERQASQDSTTKEIIELLETEPWSAENAQVTETLGQIEERQIAQERAITEILTVLESQPWQASVVKIQRELSTITDMLDKLLTENQEVGEIEVEEALPALAANLSNLMYEIEVESETNGVVAVRFLPGDNVWNIVSRFYQSPSTGLVNRILEFNDIGDSRILPVGFRLRIPLGEPDGCDER